MEHSTCGHFLEVHSNMDYDKKNGFFSLKELRFLAGQTFFLCFFLRVDVLDVTVRLICCVGSACLSWLGSVKWLSWNRSYFYMKALWNPLIFFPGLAHLIGSSLLRAYMHGFFMDIRLYHKVNKADPCQLLLETVKYMCWLFVEGCVFYFSANNGLCPVLMLFLFTSSCLFKGKNDGKPLCLWRIQKRENKAEDRRNTCTESSTKGKSCKQWVYFWENYS